MSTQVMRRIHWLHGNLDPTEAWQSARAFNELDPQPERFWSCKLVGDWKAV